MATKVAVYVYFGLSRREKPAFMLQEEYTD
jgi:hypothetical protein